MAAITLTSSSCAARSCVSSCPGGENTGQASVISHRLDNPSQHQLPGDLVPGSGVLEPQHPVTMRESVQQVPIRLHDRQRANRSRSVQAQTQLEV